MMTVADVEEVLELVPEEPEDRFPWAADNDERRRAFIVELMLDAEIDGNVLVQNMDTVFHWLKNGTVPQPQTAPVKKQTLKSV